jgi:glutathione S-transferase
MITLYYAPQTSATRVHIALEELGVPYEKVRVRLDQGDQRKPEFLAINPNGKVPALLDGDVKLFESGAILTYLGETYGIDKGLWPKAGTPERGQALAWLFWGATEPQSPLFTWVMNAADIPRAYPKEHRSAFAAEKAVESWKMALGVLDRHLEGRPYLVGPSFTFADIAVNSVYRFAQRMTKLPIEGKNVGAWMDRVTSRPSVQTVMSEPR